MALIDAMRPAKDTKPDKTVTERMKRGRARMAEGAAKRNECLAFHRGDQYVHEGRNGNLVVLPTHSGPGGKPNHRVRMVNNLIVDAVQQEVSAATSRVPSYSITPSTMDPEDVSAARLSEKVAVYGFDKWNIRQKTERVVSYAVIADEGFAWPYFDNTIGDRIDDEVATGEIRIRVFGPNEVYWEPGVAFEDSRWHCVEQARPVSEVEAMPGFIGGKITANAKTSDVLDENQKGADLVLVTEYLERPSIANPNGRRVVMANDKVVLPEEPYPLVDPKGRRVDEPVLHRLGYFMDPASDRALGLVRFLVDPQRTINDCYNKLLEWKNLALAPQVLAPRGAFSPGMKLTDEPGAIFEYEPNGQQAPQWRQTPQVPRELFDIASQQEQRMGRIAAPETLEPRGSSLGVRRLGAPRQDRRHAAGDREQQQEPRRVVVQRVGERDAEDEDDRVGQQAGALGEHDVVPRHRGEHAQHRAAGHEVEDGVEGQRRRLAAVVGEHRRGEWDGGDEQEHQQRPGRDRARERVDPAQRAAV
jgi:hypothetical protein